ATSAASPAPPTRRRNRGMIPSVARTPGRPRRLAHRRSTREGPTTCARSSRTASFETSLQFLSRAGEAGHDRADRKLRDRRDLLVGALLEFAQDEDLAELRREALERAHQAIAVV